MERIAKEIPKPCFALEYDLSTDTCRDCTVKTACFEALGRRKTRVTLDKLEFKFVPVRFNIKSFDMGGDPELPQIEQTYDICHQAIFGYKPKSKVKVGLHSKEVIRNFRKAKVSLRMFMLTNMFAFKVAHEIQRPGMAVEGGYSPAKLAEKAAIERVNIYRAACRREFGTFDLGALSTLGSENYGENDVEQKLLNSEIEAGNFIVGYKVRSGGPVLESFYRASELSLDPHWLAMEPSYDTIKKAHLSGEKAPKPYLNHRFSVDRVTGEMKRNKDWAVALFQAHERIMQKAIDEVLRRYGLTAKDLESEAEPVTDVIEFWTNVARAIQHLHCLRLLRGETSLFSR